MLILSLVVGISMTNAQIKPADSLPYIQLKNSQNTEFNLRSLKGKVVLIDFWASWCAPCRIANKKLVLLHREYGNQNFEIVGISLDMDKTKWMNAIQKDKLAYKQLIDSKGFDAKSALLFGVEQLPSSYLFDVSGILIAINPSEEEIIAQIKK